MLLIYPWQPDLKMLKLAETIHAISPSPQRKLGSSDFDVAKALDPSFRWDDGDETWGVAKIALRVGDRRENIFALGVHVDAGSRCE